MAINQILEKALQDIVAERDTKVNVVKQESTKNKIVPHNAQIDTASNTAIAKLQKEFAEKSSAEQQAFNQRVAELQQEFTQKKQAIIEAGKAEKEEFERVTLIADTAEVVTAYDKAIAELKKQIQANEG